MNLVEQPRNLQFFLWRVCDARRLLSVAEGLLPNLDPLWDSRREARFDEVIVDQAFLRDEGSPASCPV